MDSYRVLAGAVLVGLVVGSGVLDGSEPAPQETAAAPALAPPSYASPPPVAYEPPLPPEEIRRRRILELAHAYAGENGTISLNEMRAIAAAVDGEDLPARSVRQSTPPLGYVPPAMPSPYAGAGSAEPTVDERRYRGTSGARYQYDLSRPGDQVRYSTDVRAQLRDSIDPRVSMDRSMGQYGGGIQR